MTRTEIQSSLDLIHILLAGKLVDAWNAGTVRQFEEHAKAIERTIRAARTMLADDLYQIKVGEHPE